MFRKDDEHLISTTSPWMSESQLGEVSEEDLLWIKSVGEKKCYAKGDIILHPGTYVDQLCYIDTGTVYTSLFNAAGEEKVICYSDRFVTAECFFNQEPIFCTAIALDEVTIYAIDRRYLAELLSTRLSIVSFILEVLSAKCRIFGWQINDLSMSCVYETICRLLCCYVIDHHLEDEPLIKINLTHKELAILAGAHRVTVSRVIATLKNNRILTTDEKNHLIITNWKGLKKIGFDDKM